MEARVRRWSLRVPAHPSFPPARSKVKLVGGGVDRHDPRRADRAQDLDGHVAPRSGEVRQQAFGHIACGCEVEAERRFGDLVVPSSVTGAR